jgi:hypothetical protein
MEQQTTRTGCCVSTTEPLWFVIVLGKNLHCVSMAQINAFSWGIDVSHCFSYKTDVFH